MRAFWPDKLSHYTNRELLGAGQFGLVYLVQNPELKQKTIIKIIEAVRDIDPVIIKRFRREIKSLQKLNSPHIVKLLNYWIDDSFLAFESEYISGISLENLLALFKEIPYPRKKESIVNIISQICQGLEYLHQHRLVHRDIKPSNLLLELRLPGPNFTAKEILVLTEKNDFCCKITDLGIVKELGASVSITRTSDFIGTAAYISPEQAVGKKVGQASDMYSLGVLWYELISGVNPFYRKNIYHTINAHLNETAQDIGVRIPGVDQKTSGVIMLLLHKESNQRAYNAARLHQFLHMQKKQEIKDQTNELPEKFKTESKKHKCPSFEEFIRKTVESANPKKIISAVHQDQNTLYNIYFHLDNLQISEIIANFYYFPENNYSFLYNFTHSLLRQANQTEIQEFKKELTSESLILEFLTLYSKEKILDLEQFENKSWSGMLHPLKIYNWIEFVAQVLAFLSREKPVIIFLNVLNLLSENLHLLTMLMERMLSVNVFWFYLGTKSTPFLKNVLIKFPENQIIVDLDNLFKEKIRCRVSSQELSKYASLTEILPEGEKKKDIKPRSIRGISKEHLMLLEVLATLGPSYRIEFVHWVFQQKDKGSDEIVTNLIRRQILIPHSSLGMEGRVSFASKELYQKIHAGMSAEKRESNLKFILPYWENQDRFADQFIRLKIYQELKLFDKLHSQLVYLLDLGLFFGDINMNRISLNLYTKFNKIGRPQTIHQLNVHRIILLIMNKPRICLHWIAKNLLIQISDKYLREKHTLMRYLILNALCLKNQEIIKDIISDPIFGKLNMKDITANLHFLEALSIYLDGGISQPIQKLSESLMYDYKNEMYWNIPFSTCILAQFYMQAQEWENAYKYAAMGYHAGKAINDYWVMKECVELILQNEHYKKNRINLVDWERITFNDFKFSPDSMKQVDFRTKIFTSIR